MTVKQRDDGLTTIHCDMPGCRVWSGPSPDEYFTLEHGVWIRIMNGRRTVDLCGPECAAEYAESLMPRWRLSSAKRDYEWQLWATRANKRTRTVVSTTEDEHTRLLDEWRRTLTHLTDAELDAWFRQHAA